MQQYKAPWIKHVTLVHSSSYPTSPRRRCRSLGEKRRKGGRGGGWPTPNSEQSPGVYDNGFGAEEGEVKAMSFGMWLRVARSWVTDSVK